MHASYVMVQSAGVIGYQPLREVVPEEQEVHADHDGYQREHVQHNAYLSCHGLVLHDGPGQERRPKVTSRLGEHVRSSRTLYRQSAARSNRALVPPTACRGTFLRRRVRCCLV